jgi:hypothetical protein
MPAWDPPIGGVPLDLRGTPGSARLDLGATEKPAGTALHVAARVAGARAVIRGTFAPAQPSTDLEIRARAAGVHAVIRCAVQVVTPAVDLAIAARIPGVRALVRAQFALPLRIAARIRSAPRALVRAAYDPDLLSEVVGHVASPWTAAALLTTAARLPIQEAPALHGAARSIWRPAPLALGTARALWRQAERVTSLAGRAAWHSATLATNSARAPWRDSPPLRQGVASSWRDGQTLPIGTRSSWRGLPLVTRGTRETWRDGALEHAALRLRYGDGDLLPEALLTRWRDAALVTYIWRDRPPPQPPPPWQPSWSARLCLGSPTQPGDARLDLGHPPCGTAPRRIPTRRSYTMQHQSSITRLSDGIAIDVAPGGWSVSHDADAWAWTWSATIQGHDALDAVMPSTAGEPVILVAEIDGELWHLLAEDWTEEEQHGSRTIRVSGRGLSAELSAPYELAVTGTLQQARTTQQAVAERIPLGSLWTFVWADGSPARPNGPTRDATPDWLLPAGSWTWQQQAPIQTIHQALQEIGLVLCPSRTGRVLTVQPRYPVTPWDFDDADPDLIIPAAAITNVSRGLTVPTQANAVYVHGAAVGGLLARVLRTGTAGDRVTTTASAPWLTHLDAARLLGSRRLAAQAHQATVRSFTIPYGGDDFPLLRVGDLVLLELATGDVRGIVSATALSVSRSQGVRQNISIGEETPNTWARWKRLLPDAPLLIATIVGTYADGTVLVSYPGAGTQRVRGTGLIGGAVWVRAGVVEGEAPALSAYEIEV